jgi:peroxiredoxin
MKYTIILFTTLLALNVVAQKKVKKVPAQKVVKNIEVKPAAYAIVKGHIKNNTDDFLDYGWDKYLGFTSASIPINKSGDFVQKINIIDGTKEYFLFAGDDGIPLWVVDKDTVELTWDANNVNKTLAIKTAKEWRAKQLMKMINQRWLFSKENYDIHVAVNDRKMTDSVKFEKINDLYNKEIDTLLSGDVYECTLQKATDLYFDYTKLLYSVKLLPKYSLIFRHPSEKSKMFETLNADKRFPPYKTESETYFRNSSSYRDFVFDYVRFNDIFTSSSALGAGDEYQKKMLPFAPSFDDYYTGLSTFRIIEMRDWFITKSIMQDFSSYAFADASAVYNDFITKVKTPFYADTLKTYYANLQRLKPGGPAPIFSLKDENGKMVSLSSFKGKTIYIDFWGVGCGPCIYDIKNNVPALHEKYKDKNIVFINICVDANEKDWKENLKKLDLHGVNLLAEGWTKNPICKAYNVNAIPHYYLLSSDGKIVNNNADGPGKSYYGQFDKLLK